MTEEKQNSNHLDTEKMVLNDNINGKEEQKKDEKIEAKKEDTKKDIKNEETGKTQNVVAIQGKKANKTQQTIEDKGKETGKDSGIDKKTVAAGAGVGVLGAVAIATGGGGCCDKFKDKFCCCFK